MILTYHEGACVRASAGDTTLVFGPVSKASKQFKPTNFGADVALISLNNADMNGADEVRGRPRKDGAEDAAHGAGNQPFVISGPGEYEVSGITVAAFGGRSSYADADRINTIYAIHFDGMSLLYLGAQSDSALPADVLAMDSPDVLILPVGANGTLTPAEAQKLAVKLEAKMVIPILHDDKTLKQFLKEAGAEKTQAVDKLTIKPRDVADKQAEVVVLCA